MWRADADGLQSQDKGETWLSLLKGMQATLKTKKFSQVMKTALSSYQDVLVKEYGNISRAAATAFYGADTLLSTVLQRHYNHAEPELRSFSRKGLSEHRSRDGVN